MDIPLYSWSNDIYHISTSLKIKPRSTSAPRCPTFSLNVPPFWHLAKILRVCGHRHFASADLTSLEKNRFGTPQNAMVLDPKIGWLNEYFTGFMFAFEPTPLCWGPSWGGLKLGDPKTQVRSHVLLCHFKIRNLQNLPQSRKDPVWCFSKLCYSKSLGTST